MIYEIRSFAPHIQAMACCRGNEWLVLFFATKASTPISIYLKGKIAPNQQIHINLSHLKSDLNSSDFRLRMTLIRLIDIYSGRLLNNDTTQTRAH